MKHFVYILYSESRHLFYVGMSSNIYKRLHYHNNQTKGFTMTGRPWIIIWSTAKESKRSALILEKKIKNLSQKKKLKFIRKYSHGILDSKKFESIESLFYRY